MQFRNKNIYVIFCVCILIGVLVFKLQIIDDNRYQYVRILEHEAERQMESNNEEEVRVVKQEEARAIMGDESLETFWKYVSTKDFKCHNETKVGPSSDSGYTICTDGKLKPDSPCLIYSFGSHFLFDFEEAAVSRYQCEVHTFDPSHPINDHIIPSGIQFHLIGLSGREFINAYGWKMQNLSTVMDSLGHTERTLDILKLDVEGSEWLALPAMIQSGVFRRVKQLTMEVHFGLQWSPKQDRRGRFMSHSNTWGYVTIEDQLRVLQMLRDSTFKLFHFEGHLATKMTFKPPFDEIYTAVVVSYVNTLFAQ